MAEMLHKSDLIIIDRRNTSRGKSLPNRERLLDRIRDAIRHADPHNIGTTSVKNASGQGATTANNPITVAKSALHEPSFHYDPYTGTRTIVLVGNDRWMRGDYMPIESGSASANGEGEAGDGEDGEDDFVVHISSEEFYKYFFEDCELPNMQETSRRVMPEKTPSHAGFQRNGIPAQLSIIRSYSNSLGRRIALTRSSREELHELKAEYDRYATGEHPQCDELTSQEVLDIMASILEKMEALQRKISATPFFEEVDMRYVHREHKDVKRADAAFFMLMDVSGSMTEELKRIARRMFTLQYVFIKRTHPDIDIVFISHTSVAIEVDEYEFFNSTRSGGTIISPAYEMALQIINQRYDPEHTNIFLSHASDSDNYFADNELIAKVLIDNQLLAKLRHMVYFHCGYGSGSWGPRDFLEIMRELSHRAKQKLQVATIPTEEEVFPVFKSIYIKRAK